MTSAIRKQLQKEIIILGFLSQSAQRVRQKI